MEIAAFVTATTTIPLSELTTLAAQRACFGDDVLTAFRTQIELRSTQAQTVLNAATAANRDTLLASEQRSYDSAIRERDAILGLQRAVEQRTEQRAYVPPTQVTGTPPATPAIGPVLTREQRTTTFLEQRGGLQYGGEPGAAAMRFGSVVRAWALGDRRGLSDLERRVLSEGTDSAGGYTVPEILAGQFIDRVRNAMVTMKAGAQTVPMASDTVHIARLAQPGLTPPLAWKLENDPITASDLVLERVTFTARTLPLLLKLSIELSEDSVNIDAIIERELSAAMALELDRVALLGSGVAPQPQGIKGAPGVNTGVLGTPANYDYLVDAAGTLWGKNFEPNAEILGTTLAILTAKFKTTVGESLARPPALSGVTPYRTNQVSTDCFVGDFTQLLIGMRTSFRLESSREAAGSFESLQIGIRAYLRADIQLAHPDAFVVLS
jgi:HK97 family phage major capsid protein